MHASVLSQPYLLFNRNRRIPGQFFLYLLGKRYSQDTILKLGGHIPGFNPFAHKEAAAAGAGVPLLTDVLALLIFLVFVQSLGGC